MAENTGKNSGKRHGIENLKPPFKKGESGNPNGRPKGQRNYATIYREALIKLGKENGKEPDEIEMELIANGVLLARKGNYNFYKDVLDRLHGTAVNNSSVVVEGELSLLDQKQYEQFIAAAAKRGSNKKGGA